MIRFLNGLEFDRVRERIGALTPRLARPTKSNGNTIIERATDMRTLCPVGRLSC
jgi:hypothetical protein